MFVMVDSLQAVLFFSILSSYKRLLNVHYFWRWTSVQRHYDMAERLTSRSKYKGPSNHLGSFHYHRDHVINDLVNINNTGLFSEIIMRCKPKMRMLQFDAP